MKYSSTSTKKQSKKKLKKPLCSQKNFFVLFGPWKTVKISGKLEFYCYCTKNNVPVI